MVQDVNPESFRHFYLVLSGCVCLQLVLSKVGTESAQECISKLTVLRHDKKR